LGCRNRALRERDRGSQEGAEGGRHWKFGSLSFVIEPVGGL
jgi:hypothetical protein